MRNQRGFTVVELIACVFGLFWACVWCGLICIAWHFLSKLW